MTDHTAVPWPTCNEEGCIGLRLAAASKCLAHADDQQRKATLKQFGETGELDARGVPITQALLDQILAAVPHDANNHPTLTAPQFSGATFHGAAGFSEATFNGDAWFEAATFHGTAWFEAATFHGDARFEGATFHGTAEFIRATFHGAAWFDGATLHGAARFREATFHGAAGFNEATFHSRAGFLRATFHGAAWFLRATFQRTAWFREGTFHGDARFDWAIFQRYAEFGLAIFERAHKVGPMLIYRGLSLDEAQFTEPVEIEAIAIGACCRRARFAGGVQLRLRWARVLLDDADLAAPSIIAGISRLTDYRLSKQEQRIAKAWQRLLGEAVSEQPRLLSLRRANVAGLGLANVGLADCRFAGAHNLDKLRLEADVSFASAPVRLSWDWRQVIAEERTWRRWTAPRWPAWAADEPAVLEAGQIAGLYRELRKGREDAKDEPGAADFYYGEMEMRRHARRSDPNSRSDVPSRGRVERAILTAYWLVSGYGLRAWRALACLLAAMVMAAVAMRAVGFTHHRHPWSSAFLYTTGAVTHLVNPPEGLLTEPGQAIRLAIGLLGPVLVGLTLLALRGRVKR